MLVNNVCLFYVLTDSNVISDAFYFSLSDGLHKPIYKLFIIKVRAVSYLRLIRISNRRFCYFIGLYLSNRSQLINP